jgi:glycosyltransferase involved in cell wall biosynthesis
MKVSIITPTNNPVFLKELEDSILGQTHRDWEWIILLNQGAKYSASDERIKIIECPFVNDSIGFLKRLACMQTTGDVIAEVDHDDLLVSDCLAKIAAAFDEDPEVGFVFSRNAKLADNFRPYMAEYGWTHSLFRWGKKNLIAMHNQPVTPGRLGHIWFAPDHIRTWRRDVYESIGGHDDSLKVCDDLDLMHRLYMVTKFKEIEEVLYLYRITGSNTYVSRGPQIRELDGRLYDKNIRGLAERFATLNGLDIVDMGSLKSEPGSGLEGMADQSVGLIIAHDTLQYIEDPIMFMREAYRVLAKGGMLMCEVPSSDGRGAWQDPLAVSVWNQNSFMYYTQASYAKKIGGDVLFRDYKLSTGFRNEEERAAQVPYVTAHLERL